MPRLTRGALMHFLNTAGTSAAVWGIIGKHIDDMSVDMGGSFDTTKNILDETSVTDEGYAPSVSVSPYYADPTDANYEFLRDIALGRKSGDECKAQYMEVVVESKEASSHLAYIEDCYIEINSYGGDTTGFQIEYTIHPAGNRVKGTVALSSNKTPTFTPDPQALSS